MSRRQRQRASTTSSTSNGNGSQPIIEQTFPTLSVSVDPELLDSIKDLRKEVSTCLKNQALLYQLIGQMKVLEDKFERLSADTESSIAGIRKEIERAECKSDEVLFKSLKNENDDDDEDVEDCDPLFNEQQKDDPEWKPNNVSTNADADDHDNDDADAESISGSESESPSISTNTIVPHKKFKCSVCAKEFSRQSSVYRHQFNHRPADKNDSYDCTTCNKKFKQLGNLTQHMKSHPSEKPSETEPHDVEVEANLNTKIVCTVCPAQFKSKRQLYIHYKHEHPTSLDLFPCKLCDKAAATAAFHTAEDLARHYTRQHPTPNGLQPSGNECPDCGLKLSRSASLRRHLLSAHSIGEKHACDVCSQTFIRRDKLKSHQLSEHGKVSDSVKARARRSDAHQTPTHVPCPDCQKSCNKNRLKEHLISCRGLKPFACDECGISFAHPSNLRGHRLNVHRKAGRSLCTICGKTVYGNYNFKRHLMYHNEAGDPKMPKQAYTGEMNHSCPHSSCDRKFRLQSTLNRHVRLHTGEKPYSCELCGRTFARKYSLFKHKMAHERGTAKTVQAEDNVWRNENHEHSKDRRRRGRRGKRPNLAPEPEAIVQIQVDETAYGPTTQTQVTDTVEVVLVDF